MEAERQRVKNHLADVGMVSKTPDASVNNADEPLDPSLQDLLHGFLEKKGYDVSDKKLVKEAEELLRKLSKLDPPSVPSVATNVTSNVDDPPLPKVTTLAPDDREMEECAGKEYECPHEFYYLYDSMVYSGGPPVPGHATAVECFTRFRHKDCDEWSRIPLHHCIPQINDDHEKDAAEKESHNEVEESASSGSDFSETRRMKKKQRHCGEKSSEEESSDDIMEVLENEMVSNIVHKDTKTRNNNGLRERANIGAQDPELTTKSKAQWPVEADVQETVEQKQNNSSVHEKRRERPSKQQLAEVHALEKRIHAEVKKLACMWHVGVDVIFEQLGLGGVGVKKEETLWNTVLKVCSLTVPSNGNRKYSL